MGRAKPSEFTDSAQADLADPGLETGDLRLMAEQLAAIAERLRDGTFISASSELDPDHAGPQNNRIGAPILESGDSNFQRMIYSEMARAVYTVRRERDAIFNAPELFGEPAWDILLDLYVAHSDNNPVSVSSACIGSAAPPTTGLRWLGVLAEQGLIIREHDPSDQRRVLVRLSEKGLEKMDAYFACASGED